jgi:hypothetical protein
MTGGVWHEGLEGEERTGEPFIGPATSIFTFTRAFEHFMKYIDHHPEEAATKITIDGGPHTFWWPTQSPDGAFLTYDVPPQQMIREIQPDAKFLITVSDPTRRMYSDYYFLEDNLKPVRPGGARTKSAHEFHKRVTNQINNFNRCIDEYMDILSTEVTHFQNAYITASEYAKAVENMLSPKYIQQFPLWFRAAQM